ncbi:MAG: hypothetical protein ACD_41C00028G0003 [uncultured bacterium]|nr:MAG: hypothetical protein ACD_41C00028G0003 [uncultured bacterium]
MTIRQLGFINQVLADVPSDAQSLPQRTVQHHGGFGQTVCHQHHGHNLAARHGGNGKTQSRHRLMNVIKHCRTAFLLTPVSGQHGTKSTLKVKRETKIVCPREESNFYRKIRNLVSYPLNDEG